MNSIGLQWGAPTFFPVPPITAEREVILTVLLEAGGPLGPTEITGLAKRDTSPSSTAELLRQMVKDGQLAKKGRGLYVHPDFVSGATRAGGGSASYDRSQERLMVSEPRTARDDAPIPEPKSGDPEGNTNGHVTPDSSHPDADTRPSTYDQLVQIPMLVDVEAAAHDVSTDGFLVDSDSIELEPSGVYLPGWYIRSEYGVDPDRVLFIRARGNSMSPTILPGVRVMVARLVDGSPVRDGLIYVIDAPGGSILKRLYIEPDYIHVWSDNSDAPRYRVPLEVWDRDYQIRAVVLETPQRH